LRLSIVGLRAPAAFAESGQKPLETLQSPVNPMKTFIDDHEF
jgi:hypothetical protein